MDLSLEVDGFCASVLVRTDVDADVDVDYDVGFDYYHVHSISIGFDLIVVPNAIRPLWRYQCWFHFGWESHWNHVCFVFDLISYLI